MAPVSSPTGSNAERSRLYNRGLVLDNIRRQGEAGRAEIARASGLSTQAVSNIIADLLKDGWVIETGRRLGQRGQPAVTYAIRCDAGAALGLEIRPDAVLAAWIDIGGQILHTERIALQRATPDEVVPIVASLPGRGALAGVTEASVIGAGVVMPNPIGAVSLDEFSTELPGWHDTDPKDVLEAALGLAVTVENDANAAAMAQRVLGSAHGMGTFACLYFGNGLGMGLVTEGALYRGAFGNAGEIGNIMVPTPAGMRRLEDVAGRVALVRALQADGMAIETVNDLAEQQLLRPRAYVHWLSEAIVALGHAVHVLENLIDPEAIFLAGAMPASILEELVAECALSDHSVAHRSNRKHPRLIAAGSGRMTATLGAASLVVNAALSPRLVANR